MEVNIDEKVGELAGCFINKNDFSIHWIHEKFKGDKPGRNS